MTQAVAIKPIEEVRQTLEKMEAQFKKVLPSNVAPEKFVRIIMTAIQTTPRILDCSHQSLYAAAMQCAQQGLLPDGNEAALIPYGKTVRFMPMIQGIAKRVRNSGEISMIDAQVVYENDQFEEWVDEKGPHFKHVRARGDRGTPILTYAYAVARDGGFFFEQMDEEEMKKIESMSKANDSPWKGPFKDEMKRKSAIRRLAKYRLPSSADLNELVKSEDDLYEFKAETKKSEGPKQSRLMQAIAPPERAVVEIMQEEPEDIEIQNPFEKPKDSKA